MYKKGINNEFIVCIKLKLEFLLIYMATTRSLFSLEIVKLFSFKEVQIS